MEKKIILLGCISPADSAIKATLERDGYEVITAHNGGEIEATTRRDHLPDAYIVDVDLPTRWVNGHSGMITVRRNYIAPVVYIRHRSSKIYPESSTYDYQRVVTRNGLTLTDSEMREVMKALKEIIELRERTIPPSSWA